MVEMKLLLRALHWKIPWWRLQNSCLWNIIPGRKMNHCEIFKALILHSFTPSSPLNLGGNWNVITTKFNKPYTLFPRLKLYLQPQFSDAHCRIQFSRPLRTPRCHFRLYNHLICLFWGSTDRESASRFTYRETEEETNGFARLNSYEAYFVSHKFVIERIEAFFWTIGKVGIMLERDRVDPRVNTAAPKWD